MKYLQSYTGSNKSRGLSSQKSIVVSVLDVGSSKICCIVARLTPAERSEILSGRSYKIDILGIGYQRAQGIKSGVIVDLAEAEQAIRLAVDGAERRAGVMIESVIVSVAAGRVASSGYSADIELNGAEITDSEIQMVLSAGRAKFVNGERIALHSLPVGYRLDNQSKPIDPRGLRGMRLGVDMHVVTADQAPLQNLELAINRCHLEVERFVAAPYSSALATLTEDEPKLGVVLVDMGGGTTSISAFQGGHLVHTDCFAVGGNHITMDIARGLSTRLSEAERLKNMHGSVWPGTSNDSDILSVPSVTDEHDQAQQCPRSYLTRIIQPRVEEILEMVRDRLADAGYLSVANRGLVLTGGGTQLNGICEEARRIVSRNVRTGRPLGIGGLPEAARGPSFAAAAGLLVYPQVAELEQFEPQYMEVGKLTGTGSYVDRFRRWVSESF
jgi:cell division protein FtsA